MLVSVSFYFPSPVGLMGAFSGPPTFRPCFKASYLSKEQSLSKWPPRQHKTKQKCDFFEKISHAVQHSGAGAAATALTVATNSPAIALLQQ